MGASVQQAPKRGPIALLAGRGDLPRKLISVFQSQSRSYIILAFKGQTEDELVKDTPHVWLNFGEVGKAMATLQENHIQDVVMAGAMTRPAFSEIRPDWEGVKWLAKIGTKALGDDGLLTLLIQMIEERGYSVVGPDTILKDLLTPEGLLTSVEPDDQAWRDIGRGVEILSALGPLDVGQAVVVQEGLVLGVEAIEGTDALIHRSGTVRRDGLGGILLKVSKRQQEQRVDLPVIGLETIRSAHKAGLRGIAVEAGRTIILNRKEVIEFAQQKSMFVIGLASARCHSSL